MISRTLSQTIEKRLFKSKALVLIGPRQVGKTTLLKNIVSNARYKFELLDGDDPVVRNLLEGPSTEELRSIIGDTKVLFVDEAQRIPNIGLTSKIITDQFSDVQLILSGSSALDLNSQIQESLTGRKRLFHLYPVSWEEWQEHVGYVTSEKDLQNRLIYGFYPEVLSNPKDQREILKELINSYLYKDVLMYAGIRKPDLIQKLVQALAYQIGGVVVYKELGDLLGIDPKTVGTYIDILEKAFVLFRLPSFSRNLRNEIKSHQKIYFFDNGIRNAVIGNFNVIDNRDDIGGLWENFLISERIKQNAYQRRDARSFFWRTKQKQEIDYVEEFDGKITGFEFKWNPKRNIRFSKTFSRTYKAETLGIHRDNFRSFVTL